MLQNYQNDLRELEDFLIGEKFMADDKRIKINMSYNIKNILTNNNLHCSNLHYPVEKNLKLMEAILNPSSV